MLTSDLLRARVVKRELRQQFVDPRNERIRQRAADLLDIYERGLAGAWPRERIDEEIGDQVGARRRAGGVADRGEIAVGRDGPLAVLTVEDSGPGVAEAVEARMFEAFVTTKPRDSGTGLGLYVARKLARDHGGDLRYTRLQGRTRMTAQFSVGAMKNA